MKTLHIIPILFFSGVTLCSCPYSSPYTLDDNPTMFVEDALLGKWATLIKRQGTGRDEPVKLSLSKKNDTEYNIAITGYLDDLRPYRVVSGDSVVGTAFMSAIGGRQFLNISIRSNVYIAEFIYADQKLSILPLAENFTSKIIFNNIALRKSVEFHYRSRVHPMLDDEFCLRDMVKVN